MKKDKRGGARSGTGPKALPEGEKKIPIIRYYRQADVDKLGGKAAVNQILDDHFGKLQQKLNEACKRTAEILDFIENKNF